MTKFDAILDTQQPKTRGRKVIADPSSEIGESKFTLFCSIGANLRGQSENEQPKKRGRGRAPKAESVQAPRTPSTRSKKNSTNEATSANEVTTTTARGGKKVGARAKAGGNEDNSETTALTENTEAVASTEEPPPRQCR